MSGGRPRSAMQNWVAFPLYLREETWQRALREGQTSLTCVEVLLEQLLKMGLRHPSESTQAMLTACSVRREKDEAKRERMVESGALRGLYMNIKAFCKQKFHKLGPQPPALPGDTYLTELPSNVDDAPEALKVLCFPLAQDGVAIPAPALPFPFEELLTLAQKVPQRSTAVSLRSTGHGWTEPMIAPQMVNQMMQNMAMAAWAMHMQREEPGRRPQASALLNLLDGKAPSASSAAPRTQGQLAIADGPATSSTAPTVPVAKVDMEGVKNEAKEAVVEQEIVADTKPAADSHLAQKVAEKTEVAENDVAARDAEKVPCQGKKKLNLQDSLRLMEEARTRGDATSSAKGKTASEMPEGEDEKAEPAEEKVPMKRPASAVQKRPAAKAAPKASGLKRPASADSSARKQRLVDAGVPLALQKQFAGGCGTCRHASYCTPSCWLKRGYKLS